MHEHFQIVVIKCPFLNVNLKYLKETSNKCRIQETKNNNNIKLIQCFVVFIVIAFIEGNYLQQIMLGQPDNHPEWAPLNCGGLENINKCMQMKALQIIELIQVIRDYKLLIL